MNSYTKKQPLNYPKDISSGGWLYRLIRALRADLCEDQREIDFVRFAGELWTWLVVKKKTNSALFGFLISCYEQYNELVCFPQTDDEISKTIDQ